MRKGKCITIQIGIQYDLVCFSDRKHVVYKEDLKPFFTCPAGFGRNTTVVSVFGNYMNIKGGSINKFGDGIGSTETFSYKKDGFLKWFIIAIFDDTNRVFFSF